MYKCRYRDIFSPFFNKINVINIKAMNEQYKECKKFSGENKEIKNLKNCEKNVADIGIYTYYSQALDGCDQ